MHAQIHDLLDRMTSAWNAGDATAYADQFTADADYVTFFGLHMTGRTAIEEAHRHLFGGPLKGSRLTGPSTGAAEPGIRFVRPDVAIVVSTGGASLGDTQDPGRDSIMTLTAVRDDGTWRFAAFHNTRQAHDG